jgi:hypothetical protein
VTDLQYPIGRFSFAVNATDDQVRRAINEIAEAPAKLRAAIEGLISQLDPLLERQTVRVVSNN